MKQRTIGKSVVATGITLHSGKKCRVEIHPSKTDSGIVFVRNNIRIPALAINVKSTTLATCLEYSGQKVSTIEHLMAAVSALMIDNLEIHSSEDELPILDGSAISWMMLLEESGLVLQNKNKKFIRISRPISVSMDDKFARFIPDNKSVYSLSTKFNHPLIDEFNFIEYEYSGSNNFRKDISRARTFGFLSDLELLRSQNLALGGSIENAIVCDDFGIQNPEGLRYKDEFIRHKLLDSFGDLRLLGYNFIGRFESHKTGHGLNNLLCREVLPDIKNYEIIEIEKSYQCMEEVCYAC